MLYLNPYILSMLPYAYLYIPDMLLPALCQTRRKLGISPYIFLQSDTYLHTWDSDYNALLRYMAIFLHVHNNDRKFEVLF